MVLRAKLVFIKWEFRVLRGFVSILSVPLFSVHVMFLSRLPRLNIAKVRQMITGPTQTENRTSECSPLAVIVLLCASDDQSGIKS